MQRISTGTIEEKVFQRQLSKEGLQSIVVDEKMAVNAQTNEELRDIFNLEKCVSSTHESLKVCCGFLFLPRWWIWADRCDPTAATQLPSLFRCHLTAAISLPPCSGVPLFRCSVVPLFRCSVELLFRCSVVPLFRCSVVLLFCCSVVPLFRCSGVPVFLCSASDAVDRGAAPSSTHAKKISNRGRITKAWTH